jgi:hypothetical protein
MILSIKCREGVEYTLLRGLDYVDTAGVLQPESHRAGDQKLIPQVNVNKIEKTPWISPLMRDLTRGSLNFRFYRAIDRII